MNVKTLKGFEFACPTKIICGYSASEKVPDELESLQVSRPLVVTDASLQKLGVSRILTDVLDRAGIAYELFDRVPQDSSLEVVGELASCYAAGACDGFIAVGGGSVIDTTKGAAASIAYEGIDFAAMQGSDILTKNLPPLMVLPTTAGTGSEVTLVAVVADTKQQAKLSFTSFKLVPHVAILDPELTASLPPKLTATTGMDAMTHAIEAYTSIQKNPVSDALAVKAVELIATNLREACAHPNNLDARLNLALGSLMAGAAFSNAMVGIVHAIGHSLGGICHVPHGQAMMLLLPHCVAYNVSAGIHRGLYGELLSYIAPDYAAALGPAATLSDKDHALSTFLFENNRFYHETYSVPIALSELGIPKDILPRVAHRARYDGAAIYNTVEVSYELALSILEACF